MPLIGFVLASGFIALINFFAVYIGRKLAVWAAFTAFLVAGVIALQVGMRAAWAAIGYATPDFMLVPLGLIGSLLPSNFGACATALSTAYVARWLWFAQKEWAKAMVAA
jgi:hypothetical protein